MQRLYRPTVAMLNALSRACKNVPAFALGPARAGLPVGESATGLLLKFSRPGELGVKRMRWEYTIFRQDILKDEQFGSSLERFGGRLARLGSEGWDLVAVNYITDPPQPATTRTSWGRGGDIRDLQLGFDRLSETIDFRRLQRIASQPARYFLTPAAAAARPAWRC